MTLDFGRVQSDRATRPGSAFEFLGTTRCAARHRPPESVMTSSDLLVALLRVVPPEVDLAVVRRGGEWVVGVGSDGVIAASGPAALETLDALSGGWWAGFLSYRLGHTIESVVSRRPDDLGLPDVALARFESRLVVRPDGIAIEGEGGPVAGLAALRRAALSGDVAPLSRPNLGQWSSSLSQLEWEYRVRAALELIQSGQCYQVNLTRRLTSELPCDPTALFAALVRHHPAPHAAFLRLSEVPRCGGAGISVVSASPEIFLRRRGREVRTDPIKGTGVSPRELVRSPKDRAENVMIVDLARNDLGRVCEYGSVRVPFLCALEPHPGLWHLVSSVTGSLRYGVGAGTLVRATFPPASVTGAPKPRVLQAIEDLEPVQRGVYCGSVGWIDADHDNLELNVAIRTFLVAGDTTHFNVGGGIVADSDPTAEWRETELKARRLLAVAGSEPEAALCMDTSCEPGRRLRLTQR